MSISVVQKSAVDCELFVFAPNEAINDEFAVLQLASDVRLGLELVDGIGWVGTKVKDEPISLPCAYEHGDIHTRDKMLWMIDVDDGQRIGGVFVAEGAACVIVLARFAQKWPIAVTLKGIP